MKMVTLRVTTSVLPVESVEAGNSWYKSAPVNSVESGSVATNKFGGAHSVS